MAERTRLGPDLVIAGAARCGTSTLAAHLARHPRIDMGTVKEPNYFSRHHDRGPDWYDGLFADRDPDLLRLDASTSYTYPQFPEALDRLAEASPDALVIYAVRDPLARAVSHYLYYHHYFRRDPAATFGEALRQGDYYTQVSDYAHWLPRLRDRFGSRLLVVPFDAVTQSRDAVLSDLFAIIGVPDEPVVDAEVRAHQNNTVEFRAQSVRRLVAVLRRNPLYLRLRAAAGPHRVRKLRSMLTRTTVLPTAAEALSSCDPDQLALLRALDDRSSAAVRDHLRQQDARLGLDWSAYWTPTASLAEPASRAEPTSHAASTRLTDQEMGSTARHNG